MTRFKVTFIKCVESAQYNDRMDTYVYGGQINAREFLAKISHGLVWTINKIIVHHKFCCNFPLNRNVPMIHERDHIHVYSFFTAVDVTLC